MEKIGGNQVKGQNWPVKKRGKPNKKSLDF
jgi:hypothetical protein